MLGHPIMKHCTKYLVSARMYVFDPSCLQFGFNSNLTLLSRPRETQVQLE